MHNCTVHTHNCTVHTYINIVPLSHTSAPLLENILKHPHTVRMFDDNVLLAFLVFFASLDRTVQIDGRAG